MLCRTICRWPKKRNVHWRLSEEKSEIKWVKIIRVWLHSMKYRNQICNYVWLGQLDLLFNCSKSLERLAVNYPITIKQLSGCSASAAIYLFSQKPLGRFWSQLSNHSEAVGWVLKSTIQSHWSSWVGSEVNYPITLKHMGGFWSQLSSHTEAVG